jgi:hypothetical protein
MKIHPYELFFFRPLTEISVNIYYSRIDALETMLLRKIITIVYAEISQHASAPIKEASSMMDSYDQPTA